MTLTQWITGRIMAQSIRGLVSIGRTVFGTQSGDRTSAQPADADKQGASPAEAYARSVKGSMFRSQGRVSGRPEHRFSE